MRLTELEPQFIRHVVVTADKYIGRTLPDGTIQWGGFDVDSWEHVETLAEADGISFLCPKCFAANAGAVGTHGLHVYFAGRGAPERLGKNSKGETVRWTIAGGSDYRDLDLKPSIALQCGCLWHGHIEKGEATSC